MRTLHFTSNDLDTAPEAASVAKRASLVAEEAAPQALKRNGDGGDGRGFEHALNSGTKLVNLSVGGELALGEDAQEVPSLQSFLNFIESAFVRLRIDSG